MEYKLLEKRIRRVVNNLENEYGAVCKINVFAEVKEQEVSFSLDRIAVKFPNGRRWDVVEIQEIRG